MIRKLIPQFESLPAAEQQALLTAAMQAAYDKLSEEERAVLARNAATLSGRFRGFGEISALILQMQVGIVTSKAGKQ